MKTQCLFLFVLVLVLFPDTGFTKKITNPEECKREGGFCIIPIGGGCTLPFGPIGTCSRWKLCCKNFWGRKK